MTKSRRLHPWTSHLPATLIESANCSLSTPLSASLFCRHPPPLGFPPSLIPSHVSHGLHLRFYVLVAQEIACNIHNIPDGPVRRVSFHVQHMIERCRGTSISSSPCWLSVAGVSLGMQGPFSLSTLLEKGIIRLTGCWEASGGIRARCQVRY